jgi:hypothetical protein
MSKKKDKSDTRNRNILMVDRRHTPILVVCPVCLDGRIADGMALYHVNYGVRSSCSKPKTRRASITPARRCSAAQSPTSYV